MYTQGAVRIIIYTLCSMDVETAITDALTVIGLTALKEEQKEVMITFLQGHDPSVALPTGYEKSIIFAFLPLNTSFNNDFICYNLPDTPQDTR